MQQNKLTSRKENMKKSIYISVLATGILAANLAFATPKQAVEQVRENAGQVLKILQKANGKNDAAIVKEVEDYATPYFDLELFARLVVGEQNWQQATAAQQQVLVAEYRKLLIRTYATGLQQYKNASVNVLDRVVTRTGSKTGALAGKTVREVRARIQNEGGKPAEAVFSAYQDGNRYRAFNVVVEGSFNLMVNNRQQANEILAKGGIEALIADLKMKNGSK